MKKILIVDDEVQVVELISVTLRLNSYTRLEAMHASQALEQIAKNKPDLIILDLMLPGESGFSVFKKIRASETSRDIPVVFLTAMSDDQIQKHLTEITGAMIFKKPWDVMELLSAIQTLIAAAEKRDQKESSAS